MLELADVGAQVLKASAVEFAKRHNIKIMVGSSFTGKIGTIITNRTLDRHRVTGIAHDAHVVLVTCKSQTNGGSTDFVNVLAEYGIEVKFVWELDGQCALLLKDDDVQTTQALLTEHQKSTKGMQVRFDHGIGLLCVLGTGINFGTDIMAKVNRAFERLGIRPRGVHFSETRLAFVVAQDVLVEAVNAIHRTLFVEGT
ncbi:MAG: hypothetical protein D6743_18360 [Calditrichaeota bacterium]|nr:MAG: hypothetical protein D6743_18360 [Calditrichota bacterium]